MDLRPTVLVVLLFPDYVPDTRWVKGVPRMGSRIRDSFGQTWTVAEVLRSGVDVYTVVCEAPSRGLSDVTELATDLLDRARTAMSRKQWRRRHYLH